MNAHVGQSSEDLELSSSRSNSLKQRVALVVPNFRWANWDDLTLWHFIPYNLCLLASMVRNECEVVILDANKSNMSGDELLYELEKFDPDVVGTTVLMDQFASSGHKVMALAKQISPKIKTVLGGVYPTVHPDQATQDKNVDYVVIGEGEFVFKELLAYFRNESSLPSSGIAYNDSTGKYISRGRYPTIQNLDSLPLPAYDLIDFDTYSNDAPRKSVDTPPAFPFARLITSRGCPYACSFCQVGVISGHPFRPRTAENVLNEIAWLKEKFGIKSLIFDDDNLYTHKKRSLELFQGMVSRNLITPWKSIATAVFRLDEQIVDAMKESGCVYLDVAIETGVERVQREIVRKPIVYPHAKRIINYIRQKGIFVACNFILGFPTETWDEIRATIRFAEELDVDYCKFFLLMPLRDTEVWNMMQKEKGLKKDNFSVQSLNWNQGQTQSKHYTENDLTILRAYEWDRVNFSDPKKRARTSEIMGITLEKLDEIRRKTLNEAVAFLQSNLESKTYSETYPHNKRNNLNC